MTQREAMMREWRADMNRWTVRMVSIAVLAIALGIVGGAFLASCVPVQVPAPDATGPDTPF